MAAIIALDGLVPLGPSFLKRLSEQTESGETSWSDNALFRKISEFIPGADLAAKSGFLTELVKSVSGPLGNLVESTGLSREKVLGALQDITDVSDSKLDYFAAFLDASTNFVSHTGVQGVARHMVRESAERFGHIE